MPHLKEVALGQPFNAADRAWLLLNVESGWMNVSRRDRLAEA
jgi:hypothetical protein